MTLIKKKKEKGKKTIYVYEKINFGEGRTATGVKTQKYMTEK